MITAQQEAILELSLIQKITVIALPLIFAITLHEVAHGLVASWFGDQTARLSGRLSLNPIRHIDPIGTIILPLFFLLMNSNFIFGWAKPVPVDGRNMKNPRKGLAIVSLAGPMANLLMAIGWGWLGYFSGTLLAHNNAWFGEPLAYMSQYGVLINVVLAALNCLPLPPLDGGHFLSNILPPRLAYYYNQLEPYGFFILIFLIMSGLLNAFIRPIIGFFASIVSLATGG
jgi:Zn-dependent protease